MVRFYQAGVVSFGVVNVAQSDVDKNQRQQDHISDQVRWRKRTIKELGMETFLLELQTRRKSRLSKKSSPSQHNVSLSREGYCASRFWSSTTTITHCHQWQVTLRWRRASHLLGSTRMRRRKTTIQMWKFAQENALLGNTLRLQKAYSSFWHVQPHPPTSPRAFYCTKMCKKSKSTTFSYYKTQQKRFFFFKTPL